MKLTQANAAKITVPAGKTEIRVFDEDLPGFGLRVRESGSRRWIVQFRLHGRSNTLSIGRFEKVSAAAARERARRDLAKAELGTDPAKEKQTARDHAAETFATIAERFLAHKAGARPRYLQQVETHMRKHWAPFARRSVHDITRRDIASRLSELAAERGPFAANRARASLSGFYAWAMREGIVEGNPVAGVGRKTDEKARDHVLTNAELVTIWRACRDDDYSAILKLLILTGQRREEVGGIARTEIDLPGRKWSIPSARTKNGLPHEVPLSDPAIAILRTAMERPGREDRKAIFGDGVAGHGFSGWSAAKTRLDQRIEEITGRKPVEWRLHDIRRTVATDMGNLGVLPHAIEAVLNHISGHKAGVAGTYNRSLYSNEKRQALDVWAAHIEALTAGNVESNIVAMRA